MSQALSADDCFKFGGPFLLVAKVSGHFDFGTILKIGNNEIAIKQCISGNIVTISFEKKYKIR